MLWHNNSCDIDMSARMCQLLQHSASIAGSIYQAIVCRCGLLFIKLTINRCCYCCCCKTVINCRSHLCTCPTPLSCWASPALVCSWMQLGGWSSWGRGEHSAMQQLPLQVY
jgi:hypothetical protein